MTDEQEITMGANVNALPFYHAGRTALQAAVTTGNAQLMNSLLKKDADPRADPAPWEGYTALQAATGGGFFEIAKHLVELGADPNAPSPYRGNPPLQAAAENGHLEIMKWLISKDADVHALDGTPHCRQTAWQRAKNHPQVRKCLQEAGAICKEKTKWDYEDDTDEESTNGDNIQQ